jgi:hypothetical protein
VNTKEVHSAPISATSRLDPLWPDASNDRDRLPFGQCTLEAVPDDFKAVARVLRPILTHLANAAGLPSSPYFDADGNYTLNLGDR